ncbi:hypothetical protein [Natronolimnohabitans innermongolicus]|uniref:Uncharacterized protein n=1 Tax=Natronolimnohabitans innermongolicus JCM 12255 TaxID=1227499 RepID=L9X2K3_9EURY|nr:hypothetical protein [Natronolimnohabitans innermongolicus]ELY55945.1 hypothetical protein C493_10718 [Natronolimnohabitans innermongolicus JCM 12255]
MRTHVDEIGWARLIERLLYLFPPVVGVGIVGVLRDAEPGVPGLQFALFLVSAFGYTVLTLGLLVAIFFDARRIRRRPRASGNWAPNPWLNAAAALVSAPLAGVVYLARRHRRFGTQPGWSGWWLVVAVSIGTTAFGLATAVIAIVFTIPGLLRASIGLAGAIAFGSFPIAIHQDAAYVCTHGRSWRPNPGLYLGIAFLSLSIPPLQPLVAGYYLLRRRRELGTP